MPKLWFVIKPLLSYCINHPKIGDLIIYKVLLRVNPWGVKFNLAKPKIYYCNFKIFCLCVQKVHWVLKPYIHIRSWWLLVSLDDSKMYKLD